MTEFNDLGNGKFLDPSTKTTFKFDHLKKVATDSQSGSVDKTAEPWRSELEKALKSYRSDHYKHGNVGVSKTKNLIRNKLSRGGKHKDNIHRNK